MVDTPRGNLEDSFSPLGPSFEREDLIASTDQFEGRLNFSRSESSGEPDGDPPGGSPFSSFVNHLSPLDTDNPGTHSSGAKPSRVTSSPSKKQAMKSPVPPGPPPQSETKPRKILWHSENTTKSSPSSEFSTPAMRLKLEGNSFNSAQRSFSDINTIMRTHPSPIHRTPYHQLHAHHNSYQSPYAIYHHPQIPHPHHGIPPPPPPTQLPARTPSAKKAPPPATAVSVSRSPQLESARKPKKTEGKENTTSPPSKRMPCNCKKSKCVKLYCECFSNEIYCDGCNCSDCQNTPAFEDIRIKAIKETKSKNPQAFKARFAEMGTSDRKGHTMGCKCKKSECLKKYCEVRILFKALSSSTHETFSRATVLPSWRALREQVQVCELYECCRLAEAH